MTELTIVEDITSNKCRVCKDKLTSWESPSGYCVMCEPDEYDLEDQLMTLLEIIHEGHQIGRAFNTVKAIPLTVVYCITCTGHFHGCYCEIDDCLNCEALQEIEV